MSWNLTLFNLVRSQHFFLVENNFFLVKINGQEFSVSVKFEFIMCVRKKTNDIEGDFETSLF